MAALDGADKLIAQLRAMGKLSKGLTSAARAAIAIPTEMARQNAPVGNVAHRTYKGRRVTPGFLKRSIRSIVVVAKDGQSVRAALGVRKEAFYGVQFEERRLGNSKEKGFPFIEPAFKAANQTMLEVIVTDLRETIDKAVKSA